MQTSDDTEKDAIVCGFGERKASFRETTTKISAAAGAKGLSTFSSKGIVFAKRGDCCCYSKCRDHFFTPASKE